jgi:ubiquitin thioesterase OTU1
VLFDGVHYNPLVFAPRAGAPESPADRTLVGVDDANAQALAAQLARDERAKRAFTDTSTFALRCLVCNAGLRGQDDAQTHAAATGHANFAQTGN